MILSADAFNRKQDAAFAHFSGFRDGEQYSWLWLFPNDYDGKTQAIALPTISRFLPESDSLGSLVEATLPRQTQGQPQWSYLQELPIEWIQQGIVDLDPIQEIWLGFDWRKYASNRNIDRAARRYSVEEFKEQCRKVTR
ncbi:MAG TPA: hypothetical protein V6C46_10410 [Coleofasciculaceae cyanobacterium]